MNDMRKLMEAVESAQSGDQITPNDSFDFETPHDAVQPNKKLHDQLTKDANALIKTILSIGEYEAELDKFAKIYNKTDFSDYQDKLENLYKEVEGELISLGKIANALAKDDREVVRTVKILSSNSYSLLWDQEVSEANSKNILGEDDDDDFMVSSNCIEKLNELEKIMAPVMDPSDPDHREIQETIDKLHDLFMNFP